MVIGVEVTNLQVRNVGYSKVEGGWADIPKGQDISSGQLFSTTSGTPTGFIKLSHVIPVVNTSLERYTKEAPRRAVVGTEAILP